MKVLLDIKDNKVDFVMELLKNLSFVKTETISPSKEKSIKNIYKQKFRDEMEQTIKEIKADFNEKNNKNKKLRKSA
jgi:hypothetical protein